MRGAVAQGEDPHGDQMRARRQRLTAATVEDLVEAFLASKEALGWRPKTREEFAHPPGRGGARSRRSEARGSQTWRDPRSRRPPLRQGAGHGEPSLRGHAPALHMGHRQGPSRDEPLRRPAIHWYERGELSQEKAAHVAGLSRAQFPMELARTKSDAFVVDFEDLKRELGLG